MKKVSYLSFVDFNDDVNIGVKNKILSQVKVFSKSFITTLYTQGDNNLLCFKHSSETSQIVLKKSFKRRAFINEFSKEILKNLPDVLYIRYQFSDPFLNKVIRTLKKKYGVRVFVEIPTYPYYNELKLQGVIGFIKAIIDYTFHFSLFSQVEKVITFSTHKEIYGRKTIRIVNAIDLDSIPIVNRNKSKIIRLIAVSSMKPWHGYDRLILGFRDFYRVNKEPKIKLILLGNGIEFNNYKNMILKYDLQDYIDLPGMKDGLELNEYFNDSDIAISSLALHRINLKSASTLKAREYAARGLPIITASNEDVEVDSSFILKFKPNESAIEIEKIIKFYNEIYSGNNNKTISNSIRSSVIKKCDINNSFLSVIESFKEA